MPRVFENTKKGLCPQLGDPELGMGHVLEKRCLEKVILSLISREVRIRVEGMAEVPRQRQQHERSHGGQELCGVCLEAAGCSRSVR